jgi:hypothetical protein
MFYVEILLLCSMPRVNKKWKIQNEDSYERYTETEYLKVSKYFVAPSTRMERYVKLSSMEENAKLFNTVFLLQNHQGSNKISGIPSNTC